MDQPPKDQRRVVSIGTKSAGEPPSDLPPGIYNPPVVLRRLLVQEIEAGKPTFPLIESLLTSLKIVLGNAGALGVGHICHDDEVGIGRLGDLGIPTSNEALLDNVIAAVDRQTARQKQPSLGDLLDTLRELERVADTPEDRAEVVRAVRARIRAMVGSEAAELLESPQGLEVPE